MHALDVLGDPVRRRILEVLADGEQAAGTVVAAVGAEFGISQPAVSQHLRVLREHGFARVRADGTRRLYAIQPEALHEADVWLERFRGFWEQRLDALGTELARGRRAHRADTRPDARFDGPTDEDEQAGARPASGGRADGPRPRP